MIHGKFGDISCLSILRTSVRSFSATTSLASHVHVTQLWVYPVKSCRGHSVQTIQVDRRGLIGDRRWIVAAPRRRRGNSHRDSEVFLTVTQRTHPQMARIVPELGDGGLLLRWLPLAGAGNIPDVQLQGHSDCVIRHVDVWGDVVECCDEGDDAASFLTQALQLPGARLLRMTSQPRRTGPHTVETSLADAYPLLLASESSLQALNVGRESMPIAMDRFRPNIVVSGGVSFEEDAWSTLRGVDCGTPLLHCVQPCQRCSVPNVDQTAGATGGDVVQTLQELRNGSVAAASLKRFSEMAPASELAFNDQVDGTFFGIHAVPESALQSHQYADSSTDGNIGSLSVGDKLLVESKT